MVEIKSKPVPVNAIENSEKFALLKADISKTLFEIEKNQYVFVSMKELENVDMKVSKLINSLRKFFNLKQKGIDDGIGITSIRMVKTVNEPEPMVEPVPEPEKKTKKKD